MDARRARTAGAALEGAAASGVLLNIIENCFVVCEGSRGRSPLECSTESRAATRLADRATSHPLAPRHKPTSATDDVRRTSALRAEHRPSISRGVAASASRVARDLPDPPSSSPGDSAEQSNIVVFGGTGGTGSECVVQALRRGAKVTVLARDPSKMRQPPGTGGANEGAPVSDPNLTVVRGNVSNPADVAKVITKDTTGVVVSLGGKTKDVGATMLTDGTTNVINAMKAAGIATDARIAIVTSIGAGIRPTKPRSSSASSWPPSCDPSSTTRTTRRRSSSDRAARDGTSSFAS